MDLANLPDYFKSPDVVLSDKVEWLNGSPPDYSSVDELYSKERLKVHPEGSLEEMVTNLVKNWEREASHKKNLDECRTFDGRFKVGSNGRMFTIDDVVQHGVYNLLIRENELYAASRVESSEESHKIFRTALKSGFAWECLEVYSPGLRKLAFKWRHWGKVDGEMKCPMRNGKDLIITPNVERERRVELFGVSVLELDEDFKILTFENFFSPDELMQQMVGEEVKNES